MGERAIIPQRLLYSQGEAATIFNISLATLKRRLRAGEIPYVQVGKRIRFLKKDLKVSEHERELRLVARAQLPPDAPYSDAVLELAQGDLRPLAILRRARTGAKSRGKKFGLNERVIKEIVRRAGGRCEVSGIPFSAVEVAGVRPFAPSLDRVDSTKGYLPENCRLVCYAVNVALHQWGDEVLLRIAEGIVRKTRS